MSEFIIGKNAVLESLKSNKSINYIMISRNNKLLENKKIILLASKNRVPIKTVDPKKIDSILKSKKHQGIIASISTKKYTSIENIIKFAKEKNENEFILICDKIEDPHNLGAIIRTAECAGVHGIIIPQRRSASLNATVRKSSAGALEYMNVARVVNLSKTINDLKKRGIFIYGADTNGKKIWSKKINLFGPIALIVGNEGRGISKNLKESCDELISIPIYGKISSLNVSVATAILSFEIVKSRKNI